MTLSKRSRVVLPLAGLALLAGLVAATQDVAAAFHYPRDFGAGLVDVGRVRIYPPWAVIGWYGRYAASYPHAFDEASLWGLLAAMIPVAIAIGVARRTSSLRAQAPARQADRPQGLHSWSRARPVRRPISDLRGHRARDHRRRVAQREGRRPCDSDPDRLAAERLRLRPKGRALAHHGRPSKEVQPRLLFRADGPEHGALEPTVRGPQGGHGDRRHPERGRHPGRPLGPQGGRP